MRGSDRDLWSGADWGTGASLPMAKGFAIADAIRACCTPANLAVAATVAMGWIALLGWSGAGPDGWQARLCAGLDVRPQSCGAVRTRRDETRIVPHDASYTAAVSAAS